MDLSLPHLAKGTHQHSAPIPIPQKQGAPTHFAESVPDPSPSSPLHKVFGDQGTLSVSPPNSPQQAKRSNQARSQGAAWRQFPPGKQTCQSAPEKNWAFEQDLQQGKQGASRTASFTQAVPENLHQLQACDQDTAGIYLNPCPPDTRIAGALTEALARPACLIRLHLSGIQLAKAEMTMLVPALKRLSSLYLLNLSRNLLGDHGVALLTDALQQLTGLQVLKLADNGIGTGGAKSLASYLAKTRQLGYLGLAHNQIGDMGARAIAEQLHRPFGLTRLDLANNRIGQDGLTALTSAILHSGQVRLTLTTRFPPSARACLKPFEVTSPRYAARAGEQAETAFHEGMQAYRRCKFDIAQQRLARALLIGIRTQEQQLFEPHLAQLIYGGNPRTAGIPQDAGHALPVSRDVIREQLRIARRQHHQAMVYTRRGEADLTGGEYEDAATAFTHALHNSSDQLAAKQGLLVAQLTRLSRNDPTLTRLFLPGDQLAGAAIKELSLALAVNRSLLWLSVCGDRPLSHHGIRARESIRETLYHIDQFAVLVFIEAISQVPCLTVLDLSGMTLGDAGVTALADALVQLPRLQVLRLRATGLGNKGAQALATALASHPGVALLDLGSNLIGDTGAKALAAMLAKLPLSALHLDGNRIGHNGTLALANAMEEHPMLRELDIGGNPIGEQGIRGLEQALRQNSVLRALGLARVEPSQESIKRLAEVLGKHPSLGVLDLAGNKLGAQAMVLLVPALETNSSLSRLCLDANRIDDEAAKILTRLIARHPCLNKLYLDGNPLGDEGISALCEALRKNESMDTISLRAIPVSDKNRNALLFALARTEGRLEVELDEAPRWDERLKAAREILPPGIAAFALRSFGDWEPCLRLPEDPAPVQETVARLASTNFAAPTLRATLIRLARNSPMMKSLDLSGMDLHGESAICLAQALQHNNFLNDLDLTGNRLDQADIAALVAALKDNNSLKRLTLAGNRIDCEAAKTLLPLLRKELISLDLSCNQIGDRGAGFLAAILGENPPLASLRLDRNELDEPGLLQLRQALYANTKLTNLQLDNNRFNAYSDLFQSKPTRVALRSIHQVLAANRTKARHRAAIHVAWGWIAISKGDYREACVEFEQALVRGDINPSSRGAMLHQLRIAAIKLRRADAHYENGVAHLNASRFYAAIDSFNMALACCPTHPAASQSRWQALASANDH
ncbi:hypothetical protein FNU76_20790 [Chitinimonas arctica]|uniref:Tetratricopeptide repeat protein n=1 Tax=Chitinimonas arctica TaxID=2594795 RepID=A0A516SKA4_9NEIS|nr:hypothetical protein [Chitinimonas arctica]QDQ28591.1 hypothetical protein FNU76_20790 [Chitinimonas arctica]